MTLEDFEKSLAGDQDRRRERSDKGRRHRDRDRDRDRSKDRSSRHNHRSSHHHRRHSSRSRERDSRRDRESRHHDDDGHRHKRSRHSTDHGDDHESSNKRRHRHDKEDEPSAPKVIVQEEPSALKRDSWMEAPSALDIEYVHRPDPKRLQESTKPKMLQADFELKIHDMELNNHLRDLKDGRALDDIGKEPAKHEVDYTFGDSGSQWRMTKLKGVYREAKETGKPIEEVAVERFGDLRSFDDAREEETELDRRKTYGQSYVGKEKPSGELFQERKLQNAVHRDPREHIRDPAEELRADGQGRVINTEAPSNTTKLLDQTALNRLKAQLMKAKLKGAANAAELEERYNSAAAAAMSNRSESDVVVLGVQQNRMLAGPRNEVKPVDTKRGRERGLVEDNEDMSIEDMVREERKTRGQAGGEGARLAERIAKDGKFEVRKFPDLCVLNWRSQQSDRFYRMIWSIWMTRPPNWPNESTDLRSTSRAPQSMTSAG